MTVVERVRKSLERKVRKLVKDVLGQEGAVEEIRAGRGRRRVWNDGSFIEVSSPDGKVHGRYLISLSVRLVPVFPTPRTSSIPADRPFDSDRVSALLVAGAADAVEEARRTRPSFRR